MTIAAVPPTTRAHASVSELSITEPSDADLVARAQQSDGWAEEALFRRHVGRVVQLAQRLLGPNAEADDVVQDSFLIALEQLPKLRDGSAFRAWLLRIVVHQAHRRFRKRRMLARLGIVSSDELDVLSSQTREDLTPESKAELRRLDAVLLRLSVSERTAWVLRHVEGYRLEEVADACQCSLATAKRWLKRADEQVRARVRIEENGA
ncbi:MAG: RNA polymerase sigma factor [Myxococcales bacterium]